MCTLRGSTEEGQYFTTLERVRPGHEENLPACMAAIEVYFTEKLVAALR